MSPVKLTSAIILYFLARTAFSACETYTDSAQSKTSICWHQETKSYVSESCLKTECQALHAPLSRKEKLDLDGGKNPASVKCKEFGQQVVILKDPNQDELSFCLFPDGSLVDVHAIRTRSGK